jgi:outer membrane biosynthesis protein TonB
MLVGAFLLLAAAGVLLYHGNWKRIRTSIRTQYAAVLAGRNHAAAPRATSIDGRQGALTLNPRPSPTTRQPAAPPSPNPPQPVARPIVHPVAVPHTVASTPRDLANSKPQPAATVVVPEALMRRNLVSSRVPIFPAGAAGPVVIQAIVTARGTVEPLRVVTGDPALAHAAMVAAATWRYRPYLQNGVPVNVSTTISVDAAGN